MPPINLSHLIVCLAICLVFNPPPTAGQTLPANPQIAATDNLLVVESIGCSNHPVVVMIIDDFPQLRDAIHRGALGKLWQTEPFQPLREQLEQSTPPWVHLFTPGTGTAGQSLLDLAQGEVVLLVTQRNGSPEHTLLLHTMSDDDRIKKTIDQLTSNREGIQAVVRTSQEAPFREQIELLHQHKGAEQKVPVHIGFLSNLLCISSNAELVSNLLDYATNWIPEWTSAQVRARDLNPQTDAALPEDVDTLGMPANLVQTFFRTDLSPLKLPGNVRWIYYPGSVAESNGSKSIHPLSDDLQSANTPENLMQGIQSIAGWFRISQDSASIQGSATVQMHGSREQGIFDLLQSSELNFSLPNSLAEDLSHFTFVHLNLNKTIQRFSDLYDRLTETPGAFEQTIQATKEELGVDLYGELIPMLGPGVLMIGLPERKSSNNSLVLAIDIQNPDNKVERIAELLHRLFADDIETKQEKISGESFPLWRISVDFQQPNSVPDEVGLMVARGKLWCASSADAIKTYLALESALSNPERQETQAQDIGSLFAKGMQSDGGYALVSVVDWKRFLEPTYQRLRERGPDHLNSTDDFASRVMATILENVDSHSEIDFSRLPNYSHVGPQLGKAVWQLRPFSRGWEVSFQWIAPSD